MSREAPVTKGQCAGCSVEPLMKVASFNINDINRRLTNLLTWLREAEPGIVCLQELKAPDAEFPAEAIRQAGYHALLRGEKRWNGVAHCFMQNGQFSSPNSHHPLKGWGLR